MGVVHSALKVSVQFLAMVGVHFFIRKVQGRRLCQPVYYLAIVDEELRQHPHIDFLKELTIMNPPEDQVRDPARTRVQPRRGQSVSPQ